MSTKFPGGLITKTPVTPAGPYETGAAPGVWTVEQALQYTKQGIWPTAGNVPAYIEDVFSTYLYTGNGSTQTITNGIDLSGKGGLVWLKERQPNGFPHRLQDSARGVQYYLDSASTAAQAVGSPQIVSSFNSDGFSLNANGLVNGSGNTEVSWTFRKQPKFFDVVTWTGDDVIGRQIPHNLGSVPGCIMVKQTNATRDWVVYHTSIGNTKYLTLNSTSSAGTQSFWNNTTPTSTVFTVGDWGAVNGGGNTYVAYLFASNAGGFGLTGTDNVISCGSFDATSAGSVELGYEPQWVLIKASNDVGSWHLQDNMRGYTTSGNNPTLDPDRSVAEFSGGYTNPTATGFKYGGMGSSFIYIAIRRGPMKVPTSGTSVYATSTSDTVNNPEYISNFPVDMEISTNVTYGGNRNTSSRLLQGTFLFTNSTNAESAGSQYDFSYMNGWATNAVHDSAYRSWMWRRAPSFFDEVCYTGTGTATTVAHNLGVVPELMIVKSRSAAGNQWAVYAAPSGNTNVIYLNKTDATSSNQYVWNNTTPTSTVFTVSIAGAVNTSAATYVAYLFATCAGVSKVGSYTGNGSTQTINCGFTGGARFVLIKRTDSTGDWYVWDTARGMVAGTDPNLQLNTTNAETNTNSIYTTTGGFQIVSTAAGINASGGTYIYLAIA